MLLATVLLLFASVMDLDLGLVRLGNAMAETVAASFWLGFGVWVGLAVLFFAAPEGHAKAVGLENVKIMLVLSG